MMPLQVHVKCLNGCQMAKFIYNPKSKRESSCRNLDTLILCKDVKHLDSYWLLVYIQLWMLYYCRMLLYLPVPGHELYG